MSDQPINPLEPKDADRELLTTQAAKFYLCDDDIEDNLTWAQVEQERLVEQLLADIKIWRQAFPDRRSRAEKIRDGIRRRIEDARHALAEKVLGREIEE